MIRTVFLVCLSVVTFGLVGGYLATTTDIPNDADEVPSTHIPELLTRPTNVNIIEGESVTFHCRVDNLEGLVAIWKKNEEVYFVSNTPMKQMDSRFVLQKDGSFHITNARRNDTGNYTCQISTVPPLELHHQLNVRVPPPAKTIPESGTLAVKIGDTIRIGCEAQDDQDIIISWTHANNALSQNTRILVVEDAKKTDAGIYECKVDNEIDVPAVGRIHVKVQYRPDIETPSKLIYTGERASAEIVCIVYGEPSPRVTWLKDGGKILFSKDRHYNTATSGHKHTLKIRKVIRQDLGNYTCKAENHLGDASETIELTGLAAPVEFKHSFNDVRPNSYAMKWSVKSHSPVNEFLLKFRKRNGNGEPYEWEKVSIPAEKHPGLIHTHSYDITGLEPATVYEAIIMTKNEFGWNEPSEIFIFKTEGAVIETEDEEEPESETDPSHERIIKDNEVTSSSKSETRMNEDANNPDSAESVHCTTYQLLVAAVLLVILW